MWKSHPQNSATLLGAVTVFHWKTAFYFFLLALHEREGMLSFSLLNFILFLLVCYFYGILAQNFCFQLNKITCQLWHILLSLVGISKSWITL